MTSALSASNRMMAILLPRLATDRLARQRWGKSWRIAGRPAGEPPYAVVEKAAGAFRLVAVDEEASRLGLRRGMALADARALRPELAIDEANPAADAALLAAVADWADRYTPLIGLAEPAGLSLDIAGSAHLFGGEAALLADCQERLTAQGFAASVAMADTLGAAAALASHGGGGILAEGGDVAAALSPLPLAALRLPAEMVAALGRLGLKTIADLLEKPRAPLVARFGPLPINRLDQALGRQRESISPRQSLPDLVAERRFAEPVSLLGEIEAVVHSLAGSLAESLERRGEGARMVELALYRVDGHVTRVSVGMAEPVRTPRMMVSLLGERLATRAEGGLDVGFGYDMLRLSVRLAAPLDPLQTDLAGESHREADIGRLIDRLGARLGIEAVTRLIPQESHIPERTALAVPAAASRAGAFTFAEAPRPDSGVPPEFPLRLLASPEPVEALAGVPDGPPIRFRWRRVLYDVVKAEGPERIAGEWWRAASGEEPLTRDYFRVEDPSGRRFWLYRDGLFGRETASPRWYVHGLFA